MNIDAAIQSFPLWAQWITSWGMRLYPSYDWSYWAGDYGEFSSCFTSDKFGIKARQVTWENWRASHRVGYYSRVRRRGIIAEFTVEDILLLSEMDAYKRVAVLKSILHQATQKAPIIRPGMCYPTFHKSVAWEIENTPLARKEK